MTTIKGQPPEHDSKPSAIYADLIATAAISRQARKAMAEVIVRAYNAGWETGDIYEALNEGGTPLNFGTIEAIAQRNA